MPRPNARHCCQCKRTELFPTFISIVRHLRLLLLLLLLSKKSHLLLWANSPHEISIVQSLLLLATITKTMLNGMDLSHLPSRKHSSRCPQSRPQNGIWKAANSRQSGFITFSSSSKCLGFFSSSHNQHYHSLGVIADLTDFWRQSVTPRHNPPVKQHQRNCRMSDVQPAIFEDVRGCVEVVSFLLFECIHEPHRQIDDDQKRHQFTAGFLITTDWDGQNISNEYIYSCVKSYVWRLDYYSPHFRREATSAKAINQHWRLDKNLD